MMVRRRYGWGRAVTQVRPERGETEGVRYRQPGEPVLLRFLHTGFFDPGDSLRFAVPMRVVRDDAEQTMLYTAAGSAIRKRVHANGLPIPREVPYRERVTLDTVLGEGTWTPYHSLSIVGVGSGRLPRFRRTSFWRLAMKTLTLAGTLLALALAGCAMPDSGSRSSMSRTETRAATDPANYHAYDFGEPNNQPFDGRYSANW